MKTKTILFALFSLLALIFLVIQACNKNDDEPNKSPGCQITAPSNGEECIQGDLVTISVNATDSDGSIAEVRFFVDNESKSTVSSSPYNYDWDTSDESIGNHSLKATSVDNEGASTSDELTVEVITGEYIDFSASPTSGDAPLIVDFTDQSTNSPTSWNWDFGDGENSTEQSPSHTYDNMGQYNVSLTTTNESGSDTEIKTNFITVKGSFTDPRDDQTYSIVTIGTQTWFAENLNFETTDSWWYNNGPANGDVYGRLYTWDAALTACPNGWHLSSDDEWKTLEMYLGMSQSEADKTDYRGTDEADKLKSTSDWKSPDNGTDEVGFTALPGGMRSSIGVGQYMNTYGSWWMLDESHATGGWRRAMDNGRGEITRTNYNKEYGFSVRCIKD